MWQLLFETFFGAFFNNLTFQYFWGKYKKRSSTMPGFLQICWLSEGDDLQSTSWIPIFGACLWHQGAPVISDQRDLHYQVRSIIWEFKMMDNLSDQIEQSSSLTSYNMLLDTRWLTFQAWWLPARRVQNRADWVSCHFLLEPLRVHCYFLPGSAEPWTWSWAGLHKLNEEISLYGLLLCTPCSWSALAHLLS